MIGQSRWCHLGRKMLKTVMMVLIMIKKRSKDTHIIVCPHPLVPSAVITSSSVSEASSLSSAEAESVSRTYNPYKPFSKDSI